MNPRACLFFLLVAILPVPAAFAAAPLPFEASYDASYDSFSASATRSLRLDAGTGLYQLQQNIRLTLFGATVSAISETSNFRWQDEQPLPQHYEFLQDGVGERQRSASFDHAAARVDFTVDERSGSLPLTGVVFDELSGYLALREPLAAGESELSLGVFDRDQLETQRYRVLGEELLATPAGEFTAIRLERLREGNSERKTELWLAPALDYLLVKLVQTEPNGRVIRLDLEGLNREDPAAP